MATTPKNDEAPEEGTKYTASLEAWRDHDKRMREAIAAGDAAAATAWATRCGLTEIAIEINQIRRKGLKAS